ncbi:fungal-specific transcription factor domain-containing protein [Aspergillus multicolor]|uniref:Zn(II)2Cys6 transcription factor n=1 Tax=Aspergillus multicolor TaxID=41759 RepID=UPI003CCD613B
MRTRSGCLTCRRRKKKCDEQKPRCAACARNGLLCSWPPLPPTQIDEAIIVSNQEAGATDSGANISEAPHLQLCDSPRRTGMFLPESSTLLSHYLARTGGLLATVPTGLNPFTSSVVAIAYNDDLVMHPILALSGSHLSFQLGDRRDRNGIERATYTHYSQALKSMQRAVSDPNLDTVAVMKVLLSMMLLCHYEAISGNLAGSMFSHLRASRKLILRLRKCRDIFETDDCKMHYGLIIELYSYIVLANSITPYGMIPSRAIPLDPFLLSLHSELGDFEAFGTMFGGTHELFEVLMHVSVHADQGIEPRPSLDAENKYALLKARVLQWTPPTIASADPIFLAQRTGVLEVIRHAVLIYLETMTRLVSRDDEVRMEQIQGLVDIAVAYMRQATYSPYQCIALWALIIVGTCSTRHEDQETVSGLLLNNQFKMRNTVQAGHLLKMLWADSDPYAIGPYGLGIIMRKHGICYAVV